MGVNGSVHTVCFFLMCDCVFKLHYMGVNGSVHTVRFFLIATVFLNYITWESMEVFTLCVFF